MIPDIDLVVPSNNHFLPSQAFIVSSQRRRTIIRRARPYAAVVPIPRSTDVLLYFTCSALSLSARAGVTASLAAASVAVSGSLMKALPEDHVIDSIE